MSKKVKELTDLIEKLGRKEPSDERKYSLGHFTEECIMNSDFQGCVAGRITFWEQGEDYPSEIRVFTRRTNGFYQFNEYLNSKETRYYNRDEISKILNIIDSQFRQDTAYLRQKLKEKNSKK